MKNIEFNYVQASISYLSLLILVANGGSVYLTYWAMQISEHSQPSYIIGR